MGNLGNTYYFLGEYQTAINYIEQALLIAREIGDRQNEGELLGNLGSVYSALGQYVTAIDYHKEALVIARRIGDRAGESSRLNNLGSAHHYLGRYAEAIDYYEQALLIAREIGSQHIENAVLSHLGETHLMLGQYQIAIDYQEQALNSAREIGVRRPEMVALGNLGNIYNSLGQYQTAIECHEKALRIARETGDRLFEGAFLGGLGSAYYYLREYANAIDYYEQALAIAQEIGNRHGETVQLGNLGLVYASLGQHQNVVDYYEQALMIAREIGDRQTERNLLNNLGSTYEDLRQYEQALAYYEQGIAVLESLRAQLRVEGWKTSFAAEHSVSYRNIIRVFFTLKRPAEAFHYVQRAKARTFLDQLGNPRLDPRATDDFTLVEQEQTLLDEIRGLETILSGRQDATSLDMRDANVPVDLPPEQRKEIQARLEVAYREYDQLLAQIQRTNPQYAALRTVQASTLITIQKTLPPDVTLVEYYVGSDRQAFAFVVTREDFHAIMLELPHQAVNTEMERFQAEAQTSLAGVPGSLQTLYEWLFAPLREYVTTPVLLLAPHQQLHYLPFAALHDGERYLVEDYIILYTPSASVLEYLMQNAANTAASGALVLGNPTNAEVSNLPGAEREAQAIADLLGATAFLGADATEARLWGEVAGQRYIHLAAHGSFNPVAPQFSRIYLAPGGDKTLPAERRDGFLETREVWNLPMESAQLVTLSACQTQLGDLSTGDEWVGLSRAFIYAGTSGLVASLWNVEDASTAQLMTAFYKRVEAGEDPAVALRAAQLAFLNDSKYAHPYYWAAFNYTGAPPVVAALDMQRPLLILGVVALLALLTLGLSNARKWWIRSRT